MVLARRTVRQLERTTGGPLKFALPVTSQSQSVVTLTVAADSVRLVTNRSPGKVRHQVIQILEGASQTLRPCGGCWGLSREG